MCGTCGEVSQGPPPESSLLQGMVGRLHHRGPGGTGYFRDSHAGPGHTRLSTIDRAGGAQPMANKDGRLWLTFSATKAVRLMRDREDLLLQRWFAEAETAYCQAKAKPVQHLAARMAAKEAVVESLRSAWPGPLPWRHIEVVVDDAGVPSAPLSVEAEEVARRQRAGSLQISLSPGDGYATAPAACLFDGGG